MIIFHCDLAKKHVARMGIQEISGCESCVMIVLVAKYSRAFSCLSYDIDSPDVSRNLLSAVRQKKRS